MQGEQTMPKIFEKDCKFTVIEYGSEATGLVSMDDIKTAVSKTLLNILRKS